MNEEMSKTITVNVEEETEHEFREEAGRKFGRRKGYLGKAVTEAMRTWTRQNSADLETQALLLLEKGINAKRKWKFNRDELHERG
jgi:glutaminase